MQKEYSVFIGLDVSKDKLDYGITTQKDRQPQFGILTNKAKEINIFLKQISKKYSKESILFCPTQVCTACRSATGCRQMVLITEWYQLFRSNAPKA